MKTNKVPHKIRKLTPKRVMEDLGDEGTDISPEEAEIIIKFIRSIARIAVNQYISGRLEVK